MKRRPLFLALLATLVLCATKAREKAAEAEALYSQRMFGALPSVLSELGSSLLPADTTSPELGVLRRLEGHLCLFGREKDSNVDFDCAWRKYAEAARAGDAEALFYVGFFLDNLLFDSLLPLQSFLGSGTTPDQRAINAVAATCYYMSATGGFVPAMLVMGNRADPVNKCSAASAYYARAAHEMMGSFNRSYQPGQQKVGIVLTAVDPFSGSDSLLDHLSGLRMYEQIADRIGEKRRQAEMLGSISERLLLRHEYLLAKLTAEKAINLEQNDTKANYVMGVLSTIGTSQPNYTLARLHLEVSAEQKHAEALNALGFIHLNGLGVPADETQAYAYFNRILLLRSRK